MKQTVLISINDGKVADRDRQRMMRFIAGHADGQHLFTTEPKSRRTLNQNSYLHMIFPLIQQGLYDNGYREIKTAEQAKYVCKSLFLSYEIDNGSGGKIKMIKRTRDLTKMEMMEFIDSVIQWASEYLGIVIPAPETQLQFFNND